MDASNMSNFCEYKIPRESCVAHILKLLSKIYLNLTYLNTFWPDVSYVHLGIGMDVDG